MRLRSLVGDESKSQLSQEASFLVPLMKGAIEGCAAVDVSGGAASDGSNWVSYPCVINALGNQTNVALQSAADPIAKCMSLDGFVIDSACVMSHVQELQGAGPQYTARDVLTKTGFMKDTDRMWYGLADVQPPTHGPMYGNNQEAPQRGALRASVLVGL